ncbi:MAG: acyl-CoA dehydrogenase family protein [Holophagaceae bacterium]|nr:acyl-CoA dehydrogenase family protein [Holophagaceae bacterium]
MLDFSLSPELLALQEKAHDFALNVIRPVARYYDDTAEWATPVYKKAWDEGYLQALVPKEYGGPGKNQIEEAVVCEEMAWGCGGLYTSIMANGLAMTPILIAGSDQQKRKWLTKLTEEPLFAAFSLSEPEAGSDAGGMTCRAELKGDKFIINGTKCYCTNGGHADFYTLFASTNPDKGARGTSCIVVPRDTPGLRVGKAMDKMGQRASNQVHVHYENAEVPAENLLGKEGMGFIIAMKTLDQTRAAVAAGGVGVARAAFEIALDYAKTRIQFGKPIIANQAISFMLADMAKKIEASRLLTWQAAWMTDNKIKNSKQSAIAKTFATDTAMEVTTDAVQILGGNGYSKDYLVEKCMRDAKLLQIYEGTNQIQRLVIAKEIQQGN